MTKFEIGQKIWSHNGKRYTVFALASYAKDGEQHYHVRGERDGVPFGPVRLMSERRFKTGERDGFEAAYDDALANERI